MSCDKMEEFVMLAYYNELAAEEQRELADHLESCDSCRSRRLELDRTLSMIAERRSPDPGAEFWDGYWDRLNDRMESEKAWRNDNVKALPLRNVSRKRWVARIAVAASLVIIGAVGSRMMMSGAIGIGGDRDLREPPTFANSTGPADSAAGLLGRVDRASNDARTKTASPGLSGTSAAVQTASYLAQSQMILMTLVNSSPDDVATMGVAQRHSRELVQQARELRYLLSTQQQNNPRLRLLVEELEIILTQIANLDGEADVDGVEMIRSQASEHDLLFRIEVQQMGASSDVLDSE